jgi:hypothetical protein
VEHESTFSNIKKKGKAIPLTGHRGPLGCETLRLPYFLYSSTNGGEEECIWDIGGKARR